MFGIKYNINTCDKIYNELMIHLTPVCPNNCHFCIDKNNKGSGHLRPDVNSIIKAIGTKSNLIDSITISGGEPLIYPKSCLDLINGVRENYPHLKISLITTLPKISSVPVDVLVDKCDQVSISVLSYRKNIRSKILNNESIVDINDTLKSLLPWKDKITLNFNLVKDLFDKEEDVYYNLKYYNTMGFVNFRLQELTDCEDLYVSINDIFPNLKLGNPFSCGCLKEVDLREYMGWDFSGKVKIKRACFLVCSKCKADFRDLIKAATRKPKENTFGVVYEDGIIKPYWE